MSMRSQAFSHTACPTTRPRATIQAAPALAVSGLSGQPRPVPNRQQEATGRINAESSQLQEPGNRHERRIGQIDHEPEIGGALGDAVRRMEVELAQVKG